MPLCLKTCLAAVTLSLAATVSLADGLCPYDTQGPFGCPEGTAWSTEYEVCIAAEALIG